MLRIALLLVVPLTLSAWTPVAFPDYAWCDPQLRDIAFTTATDGFAVGSCMSVYRTADGGITWTRDATTGDVGSLHGVASGAGQTIATGQNALFQPTVLRSADGGASWDWSIFYFTDPTGTSNEGAVTDAVVVSPTTIVAVGAVWSGEGAFVRSADAGLTWTTTRWLPKALRAMDCDGSRCLAVGVDGSAYTSSDAGDTWDARATGTGMRLADVRLDGSRAIAVGELGTALRSEDAGATWTPLATGTAADLRRVAIDGDIIVAVGTTGAIVRSEDGGLTWTPEISLSSGDLSSVALRPDGAAFAGGVEEMLARTSFK